MQQLGRMPSRECPCSSSSAKADDPVFREARDGIENSRRTGYPPEPVIGHAFARPGGGYDGGGCGWNIVINVIARSSCDEAIQFLLAALDCFASARNDENRRWAKPPGRANARPMTGSACPPFAVRIELV